MNASTALDLLVLGMASGRVSYSITKDEIFRPLREAIYTRSAPADDVILIRDENGDRELPARMFHKVVQPDGFGGRPVLHSYEFDAGSPPRVPGFFGQLVECPYCLTFWVSAFAWLAYYIVGPSVVPIAFLFALWAIANTWAVKFL